MATTNETEIELHLLAKLLRPSYSSGFLAVLSTLIIVGSAFVSKLYLSAGWLADTLRTISDSDTALLEQHSGDGSSPFNVVLLFMFWSFVGLGVYFIVIGIASGIKEGKEISDELNYVHTNRVKIIQTFFERLAIRAVGLVLLFVIVSLYLKRMIPFSIESVRAVNSDFRSIVTLLIAIIGLLTMVHLTAILLRMIALRPRLFSAEIE